MRSQSVRAVINVRAGYRFAADGVIRLNFVLLLLVVLLVVLIRRTAGLELIGCVTGAGVL